MVLRVYNYKISVSCIFVAVVALAFAAGMYIETIAALFALGIHEFAHVFVGNKLGVVIYEIEILPCGGRIMSCLNDASDESEMLMVLAGPLANFVVAGLVLLLSNLEFLPPKIAWQLINYQLILGVFNMLPAFPLDGGRIFALWLRQRVSYTLSVRIASYAGRLLAYCLLFIAFLSFLFFEKVYINLIIIGFFLLHQASKEEENAQLIFMNLLLKKREKLLKNQYFPVEIVVVDQEIPAKKLLYLFLPQKYFIVYVLNENMEIQKLLTETEIFNKILEKGLDFKIKDLL